MSEELTGAVVVITGVMAAGKSTVAQLLAERLPHAAHVRGDVFRRSIVSGGADPLPTESAEATRQLWLRYQLAAQVADGYAAAGFTAVVQDVILGTDVPRYLELVRTRPRFMVTLAPTVDVVAAREAQRPKTGYGDWSVAALDAFLRQGDSTLGLWVDSSRQRPEETVEWVLTHLDEASV